MYKVKFQMWMICIGLFSEQLKWLIRRVAGKSLQNIFIYIKKVQNQKIISVRLFSDYF